MDAWRGDATIFDVDGTLVDVTSALHHILPTREGWTGAKDWKAFHRDALRCPPITATVDAVRAERAAGRAILIMTARKRMWEAHTRGWLATNGVEHDELFMRPDTDDRADHAVKADMLHQARQRGWNIVHCWDDNPSIIRLWEMEGLPVTEVPGWID